LSTICWRWTAARQPQIGKGGTSVEAPDVIGRGRAVQTA
jgi:hypothetical protein